MFRSKNNPNVSLVQVICKDDGCKELEKFFSNLNYDQQKLRQFYYDVGQGKFTGWYFWGICHCDGRLGDEELGLIASLEIKEVCGTDCLNMECEWLAQRDALVGGWSPFPSPSDGSYWNRFKADGTPWLLHNPEDLSVRGKAEHGKVILTHPSCFHSQIIFCSPAYWNKYEVSRQMLEELGRKCKELGRERA